MLLTKAFRIYMDLLKSVIDLKQNGQPKGITDPPSFATDPWDPSYMQTPPVVRNWVSSRREVHLENKDRRVPSNNVPLSCNEKKNEQNLHQKWLRLRFACLKQVLQKNEINICLPNDDDLFRGDFWIMAETFLV